MTERRWPAASLISVAYSTISLSGSAALLMLGEQLGKTDDRIERRLELMAHVGDEFGFHLAREFGLDAGGMLGNARAMTQNRVAQQRRSIRSSKSWIFGFPTDPKSILLQPNAVLVTNFNLWASA